MQIWLKDEKDSYCCMWLNVIWMGWKNTSVNIRVCRGCGSFRALILSSPRKQNSGICVCWFSLLDMREHRMVLSCSVSNKILLKNKPYNDISDEIYFCQVVLYPFNIIPPSLGAFNLRHSIYSWQSSRLIGIELYKGDAKSLTTQTKSYTTEGVPFQGGS